MEVYRIHPEASLYYVTYFVVEWLPVFVSEAPCKIVTDSLAFRHAHKGLRINAYVIMPTHLHAVVFHEGHEPEALAAALDGFRKFTGRALADYCLERAPAAFRETLRDTAGPDRARRFWQPSRHPVGLHGERLWHQKVDYVHANPCRKGLVLYPEAWRFSSARYYAEGKDEHADLPVTEIAW